MVRHFSKLQICPLTPALVTFLKISHGPIDVVWNAGRAALVISLEQGIKLDNNDVAGLFHKKLTSIRVPHVSVKVLLDKGSAGVHWLEAANLLADINVDIYSAPSGWRLKAFEQAKFVEREDAETQRFQRIYQSYAQGMSVTCYLLNMD